MPTHTHLIRASVSDSYMYTCTHLVPISFTHTVPFHKYIDIPISFVLHLQHKSGGKNLSPHPPSFWPPATWWDKSCPSMAAPWNDKAGGWGDGGKTRIQMCILVTKIEMSPWSLGQSHQSLLSITWSQSPQSHVCVCVTPITLINHKEPLLLSITYATHYSQLASRNSLFATR